MKKIVIKEDWSDSGACKTWGAYEDGFCIKVFNINCSGEVTAWMAKMKTHYNTNGNQHIDIDVRITL